MKKLTPEELEIVEILCKSVHTIKFQVNLILKS